jgi:hypothetical protein
LEDGAFGEDKGAFGAVRCSDGGLGEGFLEVFGEEELFAGCGEAVSRSSEGKVATESEPGVQACAGINHLSEREGALGGGVKDFPVNVTFEECGQSGSAIVEKEVITVSTIGGQCIFTESLPDALAFLWSEIEDLFGEAGAAGLTVVTVIVVTADTEYIISMPTGKPVDEMGGREVEYAVIEDTVDFLFRVGNA